MGAVAYDGIGKTDKVFEGNGPTQLQVTAQKNSSVAVLATSPTDWGSKRLLLSLAGTEDGDGTPST